MFCLCFCLSVTVRLSVRPSVCLSLCLARNLSLTSQGQTQDWSLDHDEWSIIHPQEAQGLTIARQVEREASYKAVRNTLGSAAGSLPASLRYGSVSSSTAASVHR